MLLISLDCLICILRGHQRQSKPFCMPYHEIVIYFRHSIVYKAKADVII